MKIEAIHEFHDSSYSNSWADRFEPTPERLRLFETILRNIEEKQVEELAILELGVGPGFLANFLLKRLPKVSYEGLDYSESMLAIAARRTGEHRDRICFTQADLVDANWVRKVRRVPAIIVSTWALHDLLEKKNIASVYNLAIEILPAGGVILNGDFIKPEASEYEYEGGRIKPSEHFELLRLAGFSKVECLAEFEKSVDNPTTSNNYNCFRGEK